MEIYSPKAKKPENFRKNQPKETAVTKIQKEEKEQKKLKKTKKPEKHGQLLRNSRMIYTGSTVTYELGNTKGEEKKQSELKRKLFRKFFDFLKLKFIERMKNYFDYEDRYDERLSKKTWIENEGRNY